MKKLFATVALIILVALITYAAAQILIQFYFKNIATWGQPSLSIYLNDIQLENNTEINWATVFPGNTYSFKNFSVANTGNIPLKIFLVTEGLPPDWTLTWQVPNGTILSVGASQGGWLNLTIPETATSWPSWGFWIKAEQA